MALSWKPAGKQLWSLSLFQHVQGNLFFWEFFGLFWFWCFVSVCFPHIITSAALMSRKSTKLLVMQGQLGYHSLAKRTSLG